MISLAAHTALKKLDWSASTIEVEPALRAELVEAGYAEFTYEAFTITEAGRRFIRRQEKGPGAEAPEPELNSPVVEPED